MKKFITTPENLKVYLNKKHNQICGGSFRPLFRTKQKQKIESITNLSTPLLINLINQNIYNACLYS